MLHKNLFIQKQSLLDTIVSKKLLNKEIFGKYLIRSNLMDIKNIKIIDNNNSLFNLSTIKYYKNFIGSSINMKDSLYKNNKNNSLSFNSYLLSSVYQKEILNSFYLSLNNFKLTSSFTSIIILKPVKGGFSCYSSGIVGFLPRSHGVYFFLKMLSDLFQSVNKNYNISSLKFLLTDITFNKKYFVTRLPFDMGKIVVYSRFKRNNFSLSSRKKKKEFLNDYNFVFLSQKIEKKYNKVFTVNDSKNNKKIFDT